MRYHLQWLHLHILEPPASGRASSHHLHADICSGHNHAHIDAAAAAAVRAGRTRLR
jgi:hypothetical protein